MLIIFSFFNLYLLQQPEQDVGVDRSLVSLVQHHDGVLLQVAVDETLSQQHTIRHVLYHRLLTCHVFKTYCVANLQVCVHVCVWVRLTRFKFNTHSIIDY